MQPRVLCYILVTVLACCPAVRGGDLSGTSTTASSGLSAEESGQSTLADKALTQAVWVFDNTKQNHYAHVKGTADGQVEVDNGNVASETDCSGFISFVIKSVARRHYEEVVEFNEGRRPHADAYANFFAQLNPSQASKGWLGVSSVEALRPGDLIAWESPHFEEYHQGNTGHVMMVADRPGRIKEEMIGGNLTRFIQIPVIDSSSVSHFPPEELPPLAHQERRDGVGKGSIRIILDGSNKPVGYWEGTYWGEGEKEIHKPTMTNNIHFARLTGLKKLS